MKKKKIMKDLSSEIFETKNEINHDIFADKDNIFLDNTDSIPKINESEQIELTDINNIIKENIDKVNVTNNNDSNVIKEEPIFPAINQSEEIINVEDNSNIEQPEIILENNSMPEQTIFSTEKVQENKDNIEAYNEIKDQLENTESKAQLSLNDINNELEKDISSTNSTIDTSILNEMPEFPAKEENISLNDINNELEKEDNNNQENKINIKDKDNLSLNDINNELEKEEIAESLIDEFEKDANKNIEMPEITDEIQISENEDNEEEKTFNDYNNDEDIDNNDEKIDNNNEDVDNNETEKLEEEILNEEEEDDTTFNELNEKTIEEENQKINDTENINTEKLNTNIENENIEKEEIKIEGNFPKINKFGTVIPVKNE